MTRTLINPLRHRLALVAHVALLALTTALSPSAQAADNPSDPPGAADRLASARALIAENKWQAAIQELKSVDATQSADWHNLMGYSHRKARTPDLAAAERHYDAALRIDPRHRGALEYSGELYLMLDQLPKAEQRLAALERICPAACEERDDLKGAIARFKANGNKHMPK